MGEPAVAICFIHGVSFGPEISTADWATVLEESIALNGHPRPSERGIDLRSVSYRDVFGSLSSRVSMPQRTDTDRANQAQRRADYEVRRELIGQTLAEWIPRAPRRGWSTAPETATAVATEAVTQVITPLREQARLYAADERVRNAVVSTVIDQLPSTGRVVIVGHSLGSVVALDAIPRLPPGVEVALVTIGSPLSLRSFWGHLKFDDGRFPLDRMRSWLNVFDATDPITAGRGVTGRFRDATDIQVSFGALTALTNNHASLYYLSLPVVAAAVAEATYDLSNPVQARGIKRSAELSGWDLPLLASAHAAQIARTTSERKHEWRKRFDAARRIAVERVLSQARSNLMDLPDGSKVVPSRADLMDNAASHIRGKWSDAQLVPLTIGLLMASPVQPFELEVAAAHSELALIQTLNRVRSSDSELSDQEFARTVTASLEEVARAVRPRGRRFGPYLLIAGAALLAATGVGLWAAAPVGVAGAAALTSLLAAFGPGGMVGGMVTLALGSSIGSALVASGATDATRVSPSRRLEAVHFVEGIARMPADQLEASVIGWLACVRVQSALGFASWAEQIRALLQRVLVEIENEVSAHFEVGSSRQSEWTSKRDVVRRALSWLEANHPQALVDAVEKALSRSSGDLTPALPAVEQRLASEGDVDQPAQLS